MMRPFTSIVLATLVVIATALPAAAQQTGPRATNVRSEVSGSTINIYYDLVGDAAGTYIVSIQASQDGGATWTVKPTTVTGDVGPNVRAGTGKRIVWNATTDVQTLQLNRFTFQVNVGAAGGQSTRPVVRGTSSALSEGGMTFKGGFTLFSVEGEGSNGFLVDFTKDFATMGNGHLGVTAEVGLQKSEFDSTFTEFGAGIRYAFDFADGKVLPYLTFIAGAVKFSDDFGTNETKPYIATGFGVLFTVSGQVNAFVQVDPVAMRFFGEWFRGARVTFGVGIRR